MINVRIKIGDGAIEDTFAAHKLIYIESDTRTEAPIKKRDVSSYAGEPGEHTDPKTVPDSFDHKIRFIIETPNRDMSSANAKIAAFNKLLYTKDADSGIRTYKTVTLYDDYKRVKIVGIPEPIAEPKKFYRRQDGSVMDCVVVELVIHVDDPTKCDFDTPALFDKFTESDLEACWYGIFLNNTRVYKATSPNVKSITTRVAAGDTFSIKTLSTGENAWPYYFVDNLDDRNVIRGVRGVDAPLNDAGIATQAGVLVVNCRDGYHDFQVEVSRGPLERDISTLELIDPYDS